MLIRSLLVPLAVLALTSGTQAQSVLAQGTTPPTNWETNQQNAINQDAASGALNANQAAALQNREAQIQAQQQQYMNQNGGTLTPQEQSKIDHELRGVNRHVNSDVRYDSGQQGVAGGVPGAAPPWQGNYPPQGQWQNGTNPNPGRYQQWQNGGTPPQWQNGGTPPQWQNGAQVPHGQWQNQQGQFGNPQSPGTWQNQQTNGQTQTGQQPYHHHHHNGGFGGSGGSGSYSGSGSGYGGSGSGNGWQH